MILISAAAIATLAGAGVYLMLSRDLVKLIAGTTLFSSSAVLFVVSAGLGADAAPIAPLPPAEEIADPLVQAVALTAVVLGLGVTVLLACVALAVERTHGAVDMDTILEAEEESLEEDER